MRIWALNMPSTFTIIAFFQQEKRNRIWRDKVRSGMNNKNQLKKSLKNTFCEL